MANLMAPPGPLFPPPQSSRLTDTLAVALKVAAIIALIVLVTLAILFYVEFSRGPALNVTPAAQAPASSNNTRGTGSNGTALPNTQSGSVNNVYNEPVAEPTTDPKAYPAPNNQPAP